MSYGAMMLIVSNPKADEPKHPASDSAIQLRREAAKARKLAEATFGEEERHRLNEVAATLDREAAAIESAVRARPGRP
jgi:hypothetical protein